MTISLIDIQTPNDFTSIIIGIFERRKLVDMYKSAVFRREQSVFKGTLM